MTTIGDPSNTTSCGTYTQSSDACLTLGPNSYWPFWYGTYYPSQPRKCKVTEEYEDGKLKKRVIEYAD